MYTYNLSRLYFGLTAIYYALGKNNLFFLIGLLWPLLIGNYEYVILLLIIDVLLNRLNETYKNVEDFKICFILYTFYGLIM